MASKHPADHALLDQAESEMIRRVYSFTETFFQDPKFDASHDFNHVQRVVSNSITIFEAERPQQPQLNFFLVILGALLHDVEDKKYTTKSASSILTDVLYQHHVDQKVNPDVVKELVDGVSYSSEIRDPGAVQSLIQRIPELAVVQDADRLDAIGAIGIGRCFTFGGAEHARSLGDSIQHFEDKLLKLESMMKTEAGKRMAKERSRRIREFMSWWKDEQAT
jgi:uncharacterized protein